MTATVTYSVEDNKIRLYVGRVPREDYDALRAAGFVATPKQNCDFVATWSPKREDLAREFLEDGDDIGDEDYSATERAADRAERFGDYRDKRAEEAGAGADAFESGPAAFGHQNRARAERQAARHDRKRTHAVSQWAKAEYWQQRTAGVIANALYKSSAPVRRSRILTLEAEQRKHEKAREEHATRYAAWSKVPTLDGADKPGAKGDRPGFCGMAEDSSPAFALAYALANYGSYGEYAHPRNPERKTSLYSLLTDAADPITPAEAAALWLATATDPTDPDTHSARWSAHYEHRLTYERAMLANEGGTAADADMIPGGFIRGGRVSSCLEDAAGGWKQIQGVNKSPVTGRVVSVKVWGTTSGFTRESGYTRHETRPELVTVNVERLPEGAYRAPTAEELEAFKVATKTAKAEKKANTPKAPALVNPTDADAERLQAHWNAKAAARFKEGRNYGEYKPTAVHRMTQAEYSARSGGSYSPYETLEVCADGFRQSRWHEGHAAARPVACKVRKAPGGGGWMGQADSVIVITDKPQKPLPLDWAAIEAGTSSAAAVEAEAVAV